MIMVELWLWLLGSHHFLILFLLLILLLSWTDSFCDKIIPIFDELVRVLKITIVITDINIVVTISMLITGFIHSYIFWRWMSIISCHPHIGTNSCFPHFTLLRRNIEKKIRKLLLILVSTLVSILVSILVTAYGS